ncbi:hypothetical protein HNQ85_001360 [Anoxybacillus calidus]|uniref:Uncharacterized protein n=1 Tax=[Anoxybacillus] calidus TaxID=575178 RepID=A0A7W0BV27_9BACL|nr:hypothetical protein [Anoxybacillus calidus]
MKNTRGAHQERAYERRKPFSKQFQIHPDWLNEWK